MVTLEEDIERGAAVKKAIGKDMTLMVDANTNWDCQTALAAGKEFDKIGVHFLEAVSYTHLDVYKRQLQYFQKDEGGKLLHQLRQG